MIGRHKRNVNVLSVISSGAFRTSRFVSVLMLAFFFFLEIRIKQIIPSDRLTNVRSSVFFVHIYLDVF